MTKFELFTMIFYALDAFYDENAPEEINYFLSDMCPFTFADENSADPAIYEDFCEFVEGKEIAIENSLKIAKEYASHLKAVNVQEAFVDMTEEFWIQGCREYLSNRIDA